jgi:hypothetical protein
MITLDAISLPSSLEWVDEYTWSPVTQSVNKALNGALIVQEAKQLKGRTITLEGDDQVWATKAILDQLKTKADTADLTMTLDYHGTTYNVMFDREQNPIEARLIVPFSNPQAGDFYSITIRLLEV